MPALKNPRWEAFAQAIVAGLASERPNKKNTAKAAYLAVGYSPSSDHAAEVAASRLLRNVEPVVERIRELQANALARVDRKLDISRERIGRNLDLASRIAQDERKASDIVAAETALAKIFGLVKTSSTYDPTDMNNAQSAEQLAELLLQNVGLNSPFTPTEIERAIAANDRFVGELEQIAEDRRELAN
jgi:hypothetical protein